MADSRSTADRPTGALQEVVNACAASGHAHDYSAAFVNVSGDAMIGDLTLAGAPTADLHAARKKCVDDTDALKADAGHTHDYSGDFVNVIGDTMSGQLVSTVTTGTAPFAVASTTKVANLNVDLLDGMDSLDFVAVAGDTMTGALAMANLGGTPAVISEGGINRNSAGAETFNIDNISGQMTLQVKGNTVWHEGNDGDGSGLDADSVDGQHVGSAANQILALDVSARFPSSALYVGTGASDVAAGNHDHALAYMPLGTDDWVDADGDTMTGQLVSTVVTGTAPFVVASTTTVTNLSAGLLDGMDSLEFVAAGGDTMTGALSLNTGGTAASLTASGVNRSSDVEETFDFTNSGAGAMRLTVDGNTVWHAGNDGAGTGLNADLLDDYQASAFMLRATYDSDSNNIVDSAALASNADTVDGKHAADLLDKDTYDATRDGVVDNAAYAAAAGNADTVDGLHAASFMAAGTDLWVNAAGDTMTGSLILDTAAGINAQLTESGIARNNNVDQTFNIDNLLGTMTLQVRGNTVWHAGNDGSGSTLDADLLDNLSSEAFLQKTVYDTNLDNLVDNADKLDNLDSTAFALLAGRAGGQMLRGGTAASEGLTLELTSHATKGTVSINTGGGDVQIGPAAHRVSVSSTKMKLDSGQPQIELRENDQTVQTGLWRLTAADQGLAVQKNTAMAGDYSTKLDALTIGPSGNVGMGVATPAAALHVQRDSAAAQALVKSTTAGQASLTLDRATTASVGGFGLDTNGVNKWRLAMEQGTSDFSISNVPVATPVARLTIDDATGTVNIPSLKVSGGTPAAGSAFAIGGLRSSIVNDGGGTVTHAVGVLVEDMVNTGTITNTYGIMINDLTPATGTQTNAPYAIFAGDDGARTYLAGDVGLGASDPGCKLDVNGALRLRQQAGAPALPGGERGVMFMSDAKGKLMVSLDGVRYVPVLTGEPVSTSRLFAVPADGSNSIVELGPETGNEIARFGAPEVIGGNACGLAFDGTSLWLKIYGSATLYELDPSTGAVIDGDSIGIGQVDALATLGGLVYMRHGGLDRLPDGDQPRPVGPDRQLVQRRDAQRPRILGHGQRQQQLPHRCVGGVYHRRRGAAG